MKKIKIFCLSGLLLGMSLMACYSQNENLTQNPNDSLTLVVSGYATLYYVKTSKGLVFYAQKQGEEIREIRKKHLNGFLKAYFIDCNKEFALNIDKMDIFYDKLTLSNLFLKYNKCIGKDGYVSIIHSYPRVRHGLKAGLNCSDYTNYPFNTNYEINLEKKYGLTSGYFFNLAFSKYFSFQSEILYCFKGASAKDSLVDFSTHYLELPVLIKINFLDKKVSPYLLLGANMILELQKEAWRERGSDRIPLKNDSGFFGLVSGIGAEMKINSKNLLIFETRLDYNKINTKSETYELKNLNLKFLLGFTF